MAQVPYNEGVPEVAPRTSVPDDYQHINASPEQFGGLIAKGEQQLGAGAESAVKFFGKVQTDDATNNAMTRMDAAINKFKNLQGADRLNAQSDTEQEIENAYQEGRKGLNSPEQLLDYDNQTRNFRLRYVQGQMSTLGAEAAKTFATNTNINGKNLHLGLIAANPHDDQVFADNLTNAAVYARQQAHIEGLGPEAERQAATQAVAEGWSARIRSIAVKDPAAAYDMAQKQQKDLSIVDNRTGTTYYDVLSRELEARKNQQITDGKALQLFHRTTQGAGAVPVQQAIAQAASATGVDPGTLTRVMNIESGGRPGPESNTGKYRGLFQLSADEFNKYGGGDIYNPADNAMAAARKLKAEQDQFAVEHGRQATPFDTYMIHQQGAAGYDAHMARPDAAASQNMFSTGEGRQKGLDWSRQAIWGNIPDRDKAILGLAVAPKWENLSPAQRAAVDNVSSRQFLSIYQAKMGADSGQASVQNLKSTGFQMAMEDPELRDNPALLTQTTEKFTRLLNEQEIADNQNERTQKQTAQHALGSYWTEYFDALHTPGTDLVALAGRINHDPALNDYGSEKAALIDRIRKNDPDEQRTGFGPGYTDAFNRLASDPTANVAEYYAAKDISDQGIESLNRRFSGRKAGADHINETLKDGLDRAKREMLKGEQDIAGVHIANPRGEDKLDRFNFMLMGRMRDLEAEAGKSGNWDKVYKFLDPDNIDKMVEQVYPLRQRNADRILAGAEASSDIANPKPLPEPLPGVEPKAWQSLMGVRPLSPDGKGFIGAEDWKGALQALREDPSEETMAIFDSHFKARGFDAKEVLDKLGPASSNPQTQDGASQAPAAGASPPPAAPVPQEETHAHPAREAAEWIAAHPKELGEAARAVGAARQMGHAPRPELLRP